MNSAIIIGVVVIYFALLIVISRITSRNADNQSFFIGNKQSPWYIVAFGMIGASLSGVTFISVPGWVQSSQFSYMQMVLGYLLGYLVIGTILMPLYYRLNLTSIYTYLEQRFGNSSYKTGASFFLLSRIIGASFRLFLVAQVFHHYIFQQLGFEDVPFVIPVVITIALIWVYTNKGGIKTIIWTDTLQTFSMLLAVVIAIWGISSSMELDLNGLVTTISDSDYSKWFFNEDINDKRFFIKQILAGAFIAIAMTGLDQDMMQKNLSCKNIKDAQKNMFWFSIVLVFVNLLFLSLGALLYIYAGNQGIVAKGDMLFAEVAFNGGLGTAIAIFFTVGLVASAYSSADSALTALTTSFCIDILNTEKMEKSKTEKTRKRVHLGMSVVLVITILIFQAINDESVISSLFKAAGYTYGPLLGLYAFGLFTKMKVKDKWVPLVAIISPIVCYVLNLFSEELFFGYKFGFELLVINGLLTFIGLLLLRQRGIEESIQIEIE